jgi:hypothetical protein
VGGDFTLEAGADSSFGFEGDDPYTYRDQVHVTGAVNLAGTLSLYSYPDLDPLLLTQPLVLIFNDGIDPIDGTFDALPEGAVIMVDGVVPMAVTYQANGDGGAVGNDFALVLLDIVTVDLGLSASIPLTAATGATVPLVYTITNLDLVETATGASLVLPLPNGLTQLTTSLPSSITGNTLTIPLPAIAPGASLIVTITVTLSGTAQGIQFAANVEMLGDPDFGNNSSYWMLASLTNGTLPQPTLETDPQAGELSLTIETLTGVRYRVERSETLIDWDFCEEFTGGGYPYFLPLLLDKPKEFFRVQVVQPPQ